MLHPVSTADRQTFERIVLGTWPKVADAWLVLSHETSLGFGGANFLRRSLEDADHADQLVLLYLTSTRNRPASLHIVERAAALTELAEAGPTLGVVCSCERGFLASLGLDSEVPADLSGYYVTPDLITLVEAGIGTTLPGRANGVYRAAKGMELICETLFQRRCGQLVPICGDGDLSMADGMRILAAKRMIADRFSEKLTLESIGRACGLNRAKLTKGFRKMFDSSISETITEHRLLHARKMLTSSDHPVSSVGYATGYLNNASFARAFHRRFGLPPSEFRARARCRDVAAKRIALAA